mmetsp:Transcript_16726/g.39386  ORF Transcript_16726/g.39386 Transcript_16726/m.39386 type:complete len:450 (-) Transcript_16726:31-1380(-)
MENGQRAQCSKAERAAHVVTEGGEGCAGGTENAMVAKAVDNGTHRVLTDSETDVAAGRVGLGEVVAVSDVVEGRPVQVSAATDHQRQSLAERLEHLLPSLAGGNGPFTEGGNASEKLSNGRMLLLQRILEQRSLLGVGTFPGSKLLVPLGVSGSKGLCALGEERTGLIRHRKWLRGQAQGRTGGFSKLVAALTVGLLCSGNLGDTLANQSLDNDHLGLSVFGALGGVIGSGKGGNVVSVNGHNVETVRGEETRGVVALGRICHGVKSNIVGVVDEDEVVQAKMPCKRRRLRGDTLLQAPVSSKAHNVVINDGVLGCVKLSGSHLLRNSVTNGVSNTLAERSRGGFHAWALVELGVPGGDRVQLAEGLDLIQRDHAGHVQPAVQEHRTVASGKHKTVAVQPLGVSRVKGKQMTEQRSSDLGAAEREAQMAGTASVDRINSETTSLVRRLR